jgi:putative MATE family efflux protein
MEKRDKLILEDSVIKAILFISAPIVFANILQTVYQLTDTFWVGRLGAEAVASVSVGFPVIFLIFSLGMGLTISGTIFVSQFNGAKNKKMVDYVASQTIFLVVILSLIFSVLGYFLTPIIISSMGVEDLVYEGAVAYLRIIFIGYIFLFLYTGFQSILRGVGEVKIPMYLVLFTVILNFFVDPLFMFGFGPIPAMGVSGVAMATVVCQGIAALIGIYILFKGKYGVKIRLRDFGFDLKWLKKLFFLGLPTSIEMSFRSVGSFILTMFAAGFGTLVVASYGIGANLLGIVLIPAIGLSVSVTTLIGNNLGAKKHKRCDKIVSHALFIGFSTLFVMGIVTFFLAEFVVSLFIPSDLQVISIASEFLKIMAFAFGFIGFQMVIIGTLRGAGRTKAAMVLSFFQVVLLVFFAVIYSKFYGFGSLGLWIAYPVSNVISAGVAYLIFKRVKWKTGVIHH